MIAELRQSLLNMAEEDERVRAKLAATGELFDGYAPEMAEVHRRNARELEAIIERYGWPGKSLVGDVGANAAWLILQHAIEKPELLRKCLPILKEAATRGEVDPANAAYLEDRICFFERRPQLYGTHFDWDKNGDLSPWRLEDPEKVDEYRRGVGLGALAERIREVREEAGDERGPEDFAKRQEEILRWGKSVGWLP